MFKYALQSSNYIYIYLAQRSEYEASSGFLYLAVYTYERYSGLTCSIASYTLKSSDTIDHDVSHMTLLRDFWYYKECS